MSTIDLGKQIFLKAVLPGSLGELVSLSVLVVVLSAEHSEMENVL